MALINRITRLIKTDFHAVLDQIEDPEQLLKPAIRDMADELSEAEQSVALCECEQNDLVLRRSEIAASLDETNEQLDLCFSSGKDKLAKGLIRKKLEGERLLKRIDSRVASHARFLVEQIRSLSENSAVLEGLRQKAELIDRRSPANSSDTSVFDDVAWMAREMTVGEDEIEIAFLREKDARKKNAGSSS